MRIAAVIPACNEAEVIGQSLACLYAAVPPPDFVLVVADHCTDATVEVAERWGALVLRRETGVRTKGAALGWAMAQPAAGLDEYPVIAVFDADSQVAQSFFAEVRAAFHNGARVVQGYVRPIDLPSSPAVILSAYSDFLEQHVENAACMCWGGSVRLRGKGMAFETRLLGELLPHVHTQSEDLEMTLLIADRHIHIAFLPAAVVCDPMPAGLASAARQRARWLRGQFDALRAHRQAVGRLLRAGPAAWWLLQATLLRPRVPLLALLVVILTVWGVLAHSQWLLVAVAAILSLNGAYYVGGLLLVPTPERQRYARALLLSPVFLAMWCMSIVRAWTLGDDWLTVRH